MTHLDTALHYAQAFGWAVHPVNIKKKPITEHGRNDATTDETTIRQYFRNGAQLAVATGPESDLFVFDIDIDPEKGIDGYETLAYLEGRYGKLPHTPHQRTGRGGTQYFFHYVEGLKNSESKIGAGIDTRGAGGYAVVAPSRNTKGAYEWIVSPDDAPLAEPPTWLIELMTQEAEKTTEAANADDLLREIAAQWLGREVARVRSAADGKKHPTLRNSAITLAGLVPLGLLTEHEIEQSLYAAIEGRAEDTKGARQTILDGIAYGKARPWKTDDLLKLSKHEGTQEVDPETGEICDPRPAIDISTIDLPALMPQAWAAIVAQNDPPTLFRRAGELARLETTESGAKVVKTVDTRVMLGILARAARWVKISYARGGVIVEKEALPPQAVVDDCMVNIDARIPAIARVVSAPTFADAETLLTEPGYHPATRVYYDPKPGATVPAVPDKPGVPDLMRARSLVLNELLIDFPFVSEADKAHAVALFLLPFVRELISGPTPLHLIEAPTMGSGKGLLADALLLPALGDVPAPTAEATTDEEWRKRITSTLLGAPTVIYIDNLNRTLDAGALAAALTAQDWSDRILGKSEQIQMPVRCVWVATANNPTLSTEISRRCIRIRIDPRVDKPWQREDFKHPKLRSWVEANRGQIIWAALVLCRYGLQHGSVGRPLGSYESWSDVLGRILNGCGIPGFLDNLDALYDRADVEGAAWRALIGAWWEKHQSTPTTAGDLFPLVAEAEADMLIGGKDEIGRKKSFGKALARAQDRVFSIDIEGTTQRLQVGDGGVSHKTRLWKLAPVERGVLGVWGVSPHPHARDNNSFRVAIEKNPLNPLNPPAIPALPAYGQWHNADHDEPVQVLRVMGERDGVVYLAIAGSQTGIPAHEVEFEVRRPGAVEEVDLPPITATDRMVARVRREAGEVPQESV